MNKIVSVIPNNRKNIHGCFCESLPEAVAASAELKSAAKALYPSMAPFKKTKDDNAKPMPVVATSNWTAFEASAIFPNTMTAIDAIAAKYWTPAMTS